MFLQAFGFIVDSFMDLIGWFFGYRIQSGITFGGIILVLLILTMLFKTVVTLFEVQGYVGSVGDRGIDASRGLKTSMKNASRKAKKWR